jgi:hypothetical protein
METQQRPTRLHFRQQHQLLSVAVEQCKVFRCGKRIVYYYKQTMLNYKASSDLCLLLA